MHTRNVVPVDHRLRREVVEQEESVRFYLISFNSSFMTSLLRSGHCLLVYFFMSDRISEIRKFGFFPPFILLSSNTHISACSTCSRMVSIKR